MANILITYADKAFTNSAWRLKLYAKRAQFFDKIVVYTPDDLPLPVKSSPLMLFKRGGGYWVWKPYIISDALSKATDGDVIFYIDSGCRLNPKSKEWGMYVEQMKSHDYIFFRYRDDFNYGWSNFGINSVKIRHWTKPETTQFFIDSFGSDDFMDCDKIWGGFCIIKKKKVNLIVDEWLKITMLYPELIIDAFDCQQASLSDDFNAHRHDQSVLTPLIHYYEDKENILILPETAEQKSPEASLIAERFRTGPLSFVQLLKFRFYHILH